MSVQKLRFSETIAVPSKRVFVLEAARAEALQLGGFTEVNAFGGWQAPGGRVLQEPMSILTIWSDDWIAIEKWVLRVRDALLAEGEEAVFTTSTNERGAISGLWT